MNYNKDFLEKEESEKIDKKEKLRKKYTSIEKSKEETKSEELPEEKEANDEKPIDSFLKKDESAENTKADVIPSSMRIIYQDPVFEKQSVKKAEKEDDNADEHEVFPFSAAVNPAPLVPVKEEKTAEPAVYEAKMEARGDISYVDDDQIEEPINIAPLTPAEDANSQGESEAVTSKSKPGLFKQLLMETFPWRGDSAREVVRKMVMLTAVAILIVCSAYLGNIFSQARNSENINSKLSDMLIKDGQSEDEFWKDIRNRYPHVVFPENIQTKFAELYAQNNEFVGWLKIGAFGIDTPIVQASDNSKYLERNFYGDSTKYGNPFLDFRNNIDLLDKNTIIFGHHMKDGKIFARLTDYRSIEGFKNAPVIEFDTLSKDYKWKVYAVFVTNGYAAEDNGYIFNYIYVNLPTREKFTSYVEEIDQRKLYTTGVDIRPTDKILTLSTCVYDFNEARLVIVARMLREGENEEVNTNAAYANVSPKFPQAWYDKKGTENPYAYAPKWYPD